MAISLGIYPTFSDKPISSHDFHGDIREMHCSDGNWRERKLDPEKKVGPFFGSETLLGGYIIRYLYIY